MKDKRRGNTIELFGCLDKGAFELCTRPGLNLKAPNKVKRIILFWKSLINWESVSSVTGHICNPAL
jgi:hypothetical protein